MRVMIDCIADRTQNHIRTSSRVVDDVVDAGFTEELATAADSLVADAVLSPRARSWLLPAPKDPPMLPAILVLLVSAPSICRASADKRTAGVVVQARLLDVAAEVAPRIRRLRKTPDEALPVLAALTGPAGRKARPHLKRKVIVSNSVAREQRVMGTANLTVARQVETGFW